MLMLSESLDEGNSYPSFSNPLAISNNSIVSDSMAVNYDYDELMRQQSAGVLDFCSSSRAMPNPFAEYTMHLTSAVSLLHPSSTMFGRYYNAGETNTSSDFGTNYEVAVDTCIPRPRWCPTREQKEILESIFESGIRTPSRKLIVEIAAHLSKFGNVGEANVFYWFQNRKARAKRKARAGTSQSGSIEAGKVMEVSNSQSDRMRRRRRVAGSDNTPLLNILSNKDRDEVISIENTADSTHKSLVSSSTSSATNNLSSSSSSWSSTSYPSEVNLGQEEIHVTQAEMESFLSPLYLHPSFLDEAYNHAFTMGNITPEEMVDYGKESAPPIPTGLSTTTSDNEQVAASVDDLLLWDDMLAVALFTG